MSDGKRIKEATGKSRVSKLQSITNGAGSLATKVLSTATALRPVNSYTVKELAKLAELSKWLYVRVSHAKYDLDVPGLLYETPLCILEDVLGGCGTKGIIDRLVPDSIGSIPLKPACMIHDFEYSAGKTKADKKIADLRFLHNMLKLIEYSVESRLKRLCLNRVAEMYYVAVKYLGARAFRKATLVD